MHKIRRCSNIVDTKVYFGPYVGPKKDKVSCPGFVFRRGISNAIYDLVLHLQSESLNIS